MSQLSETLHKNNLMNKEFLYKSAPTFGTSGWPMEANPGVPGSKAASQDAEKYIQQLLAAEANAIKSIKADEKFTNYQGVAQTNKVDVGKLYASDSFMSNFNNAQNSLVDIGDSHIDTSSYSHVDE